MRIRAIILAAGKGTRMKSDLPKVLHRAAGKAMAEWALDAVSGVDDEPVFVVGYGSESVKEYVGDKASYAMQLEQNGTGHAVMMAENFIKDCDYVVVTCGDMVLLKKESIDNLVETTIKNSWQAAVLTSIVDTPFGLGRIIKRDDGSVEGIVEQKDATEEQLRINEINTGVFCFKADALRNALSKLNNNNNQNEYYLTDTVGIIDSEGGKVGSVNCDENEALGTNDRRQLAIAAKELRRRINDAFMVSGITLIDPDNTYIDANVKIGTNTIIYPGCVIEGNTEIGENCVIYGATNIKNSIIKNKVTIKASNILDSFVDNYTNVGPNAYLRPNSHVGKDCKIGDFVEVKNSNIGDGTKISHLTYVGDADVGKNVNLGCGVVFVNYDGANKHRTKVCDNAFIGCNTNLVAPVTVGKNAYTAAGSTITDDVPKEALAIARSRQTNKQEWKKP